MKAYSQRVWPITNQMSPIQTSSNINRVYTDKQWNITRWTYILTLDNSIRLFMHVKRNSNNVWAYLAKIIVALTKANHQKVTGLKNKLSCHTEHKIYHKVNRVFFFVTYWEFATHLRGNLFFFWHYVTF